MVKERGFFSRGGIFPPLSRYPQSRASYLTTTHITIDSNNIEKTAVKKRHALHEYITR